MTRSHEIKRKEMGLAKLPADSVMVFHQCLILARRERTILKSKEVLNQQEAEKITVFFFFFFLDCLFVSLYSLLVDWLGCLFFREFWVD